MTESKMETVTKTTQTIIALGVVVATFLLFYFILLKDVSNGTAKDILLFVLGCVSSNLTQIISYYFGSSKGSEDKNDTITNLTNSAPSQVCPIATTKSNLEIG